MIKESYEGEYENLQNAAEAGMDAWKEGRRRILLHLRQCQAENKRMREAIKTALELFRAWGDSQALEILDETLKELDDE